MTIFEFTDYRKFLKEYLRLSPKKGRGKSRAIAEYLRTHPTVVSQVLSGVREFSEEQAVDLAEYLELNDIESRYLRLLVRFAGAGTAKLKSKIKNEIEDTKKAAQSISTRLKTERELTDTERAIFYSSWLYPAIRLYCSTSGNGKTLEEIMERFSLPRVKALKLLDFLVQSQLCALSGSHYKMGAQSTFVPQGSPFLNKHHSNWRLKAMQTYESLSEEELMFTGAMSIARKDFELLREKMAGFIKEFSQIVKNSPAEEIACFNMDFFWIRK